MTLGFKFRTTPLLRHAHVRAELHPTKNDVDLIGTFGSQRTICMLYCHGDDRDCHI